MIKVPEALQKRFVASIARGKVGENERSAYLKRLRCYLDFCSKYSCVATDLASLAPFVDKLRNNGQSEIQRQQACADIRLYYEICHFGEGGDEATVGTAEPVIPYQPLPSTKSEKETVSLSSHLSGQKESKSVALRMASPIKNTSLDRKGRQPAEQFPSKAATHVKDFLTDLAVKKQVAASMQNLAFNSLLFFIRNVLGKEFGKVDGGEGKEAPVYPGGFVTGRNRFHCA